MDAKDLMIGDWVNFLVDTAGGETREDPMTNEYHPMKIISLSSWYNNDGEVESAEGVINDIDQIEPIPLTTKILEKNEFYYENNVGYVLEYYNYEIIYDMWENELRILKDREQILKIKTFDKMRVHELQHALRLCGINKEIEI